MLMNVVTFFLGTICGGSLGISFLLMLQNTSCDDFEDEFYSQNDRRDK